MFKKSASQMLALFLSVCSVSAFAAGAQASRYTVLAWNDLGMHCMDADYSVFSILPPYNNLHAQVVDNKTGNILGPGVATLTYKAIADPSGSKNSYSKGKTNFWRYVKPLFGKRPPKNKGLTGNWAPSDIPRKLAFDYQTRQFVAEGIPITPYDDNKKKKTYPLVKVVARGKTGKWLGSAKVVLPVSDEMSCAACHASRKRGTGAQKAAKPKAGWVRDRNPERDYRRNVLRLHDEKDLKKRAFKRALAANGYKSAGLLATADAGKPILCAACHSSNALPGTGVGGIAPLTQAMHSGHATVINPANGLALDDSKNRSACYQCHPGSQTKCLRGAMGSAKRSNGKRSMQCQSCHGKMSIVGAADREGWLEQPTCQACHYRGKRSRNARLDSGKLKTPSDRRFATNANQPSKGFSLFRFSKGHGDLQCEGCHGATHAVYPSSHRNDNLFARKLQGYKGTIRECQTCHTKVPLTADKGPHGMHTIGQAWVSGHEHYAERNQAGCAYCHGARYRGTSLSVTKVARTFRVEDGRTRRFAAGTRIGCYACHDGPGGD